MRTIAVSTSIATAVLLLIAGTLGCGGEDRSQVSVELFGWTGSDFTQGMPDFEGADELRVQVTDPGAGRVVNQQTVPIDRRSSRLPEVQGGGGLRMEFEVLTAGEPIATGATPQFNIHTGGTHHGFRTMISEIGEFAPVGAQHVDADTGQTRLEESVFDSRQFSEGEWSGRLGHAAAETDSGEILIVGGVRVDAIEPGEKPTVREARDDIQLFDPSTGYFTELAGDSAARGANAEGEDRLEEGRGFHSLTPLGNDRFLVAGGFGEGATTPTLDSVELIDLNAAAGNRVQRLEGVEQLAEARGMHTATYRESDGRVVIAGGIGSGTDNLVDSIEIIDPDGPDLESGGALDPARADHEAVLLEDGETVWLIGGKADQPLAATELVGPDGTVAEGPDLQTARHGAAVVHLGDEANNQLLVVGGSTTGGVTASYELGNPLDGQPGGDWTLESGSGWTIDQARGGAEAVLLPQTGDVMVVGGYDEESDPVGSAERMTLVDQIPPFEIDSTYGPMHHLRFDPSVSMVSNGKILLTGGDAPETNVRNDAEYLNVYDPVGGR